MHDTLNIRYLTPSHLVYRVNHHKLEMYELTHCYPAIIIHLQFKHCCNIVVTTSSSPSRLDLHAQNGVLNDIEPLNNRNEVPG